MELVDKFDARRIPLNKTTDRRDYVKGEYKQSVHVWIINSKGEFFMQKRNPSKRKYPDKWSIHGGGVDAGETTLDAAIRECKEEIGISLNKEDLEYIMMYRTKHTFTDVYLAHKDFKLKDVTLQKEEVSDAKWMTLEDLDSLSKSDDFAENISKYYSLIKQLIKKTKKND